MALETIRPTQPARAATTLTDEGLPVCLKRLVRLFPIWNVARPASSILPTRLTTYLTQGILYSFDTISMR